MTPVRSWMPGLVVARVVGHAALDVEHPDVRVLDELVGVAVAGDDEDVVARVAALGGERGEDVVGLEAGRLEDRDAASVSRTWRTSPICWRRMSGAESRLPL